MNLIGLLGATMLVSAIVVFVRHLMAGNLPGIWVSGPSAAIASWAIWLAVA